MEKKLEFPKDFLWGTASNAEQTEPMNSDARDGKSETIWARQFKENSGRFFHD